MQEKIDIKKYSLLNRVSHAFVGMAINYVLTKLE